MDDMAEFRGRVRRGPWAGADLNDVFAARAGVDTEPGGVADDLYLTPQQIALITDRPSPPPVRGTPPEMILTQIAQTIPQTFGYDAGMNPILIGPFSWPEVPTLVKPT